MSRRLRISKATAHVLITTLNERGLLLRVPDTNNYRLGPALIPMGGVAERDFPALAHGKREAELLAEEFDTECLIVMATSDEMLIVGRAGVPGPLSATSQEGQRQPMVPPIGSTAVAWKRDPPLEEWLDRGDPDLTAAEREHYRHAVEAIRVRGYAVGVRVPRLYDLDATYANSDLYTSKGRREIGAALAAVAHEFQYLPEGDELPPDAELSHVTAPVFGPDETMLFVLSLVPNPDHRAPDIPVLARAVLRAARRVMAQIDGRQPTVDVVPTPNRPLS
jgi:DNA-binding IclR family transcriptional regulator